MSHLTKRPTQVKSILLVLSSLLIYGFNMGISYAQEQTPEKVNGTLQVIKPPQDVEEAIKSVVAPGEEIISYPFMGKAQRSQGNILLIDNESHYTVGVVDPKDPRFSNTYTSGKTKDFVYKIKAGMAYTKSAVQVTKQNFAPEFAKLFLAGVYPIGLELAIAYNKGPLVFKEHMDSLAHPMGYVGLASFMLANRITTNVLIDMKSKEVPMSTQIKIVEIMKKSPRVLPMQYQDFRGSINYKTKAKIIDFLPISQLGMASGMLAMKMTNDLYSSLKECFFRPNLKVNNSKEAELLSEQQDAVCDQALEEVSLESYSSSITSLVVSSVLSQKIGRAASGLFKTAGAIAEEALVGKDIYTKTLFLGGTLLSRVNPEGGLIFTLKWLYTKVLKGMNGLGLFFLVDHFINAPIRDVFGNYLRADQDRFNFQSAIIPKLEKINISLMKNEVSTDDFKENLKAFSKSMEMWRAFKLGAVTHTHASWVTKTENVRLYSALAEDFYHDFLYDVYLQQKKKEIKNNPTLAEENPYASFFKSRSTILDKIFPFYGLTPLNIFENKSNPTSAYLREERFQDKTIFDFYLQSKLKQDIRWNPEWLERYQYNVLFDLALILKEIAVSLPEHSKHRIEIQEMSEIMSKNNWARSGEKKRVYDENIKRFISYIQGLEKYHFSTGSSRVNSYLVGIYNALGRPQVIEGYGNAFSLSYYGNSEKMEEFATPSIKVWRGLQKNFNGRNITDFLIYSMACGPRINETYKDFITTPKLFGAELVYDSFNPPRITDDHVEFSICMSDRDSSSERLNLPIQLNEMYNMKIKVKTKSGKITEYKGIYQAIIQNLRPDIFKVVTDKEDNDLTDDSSLNHWWPSLVQDKLDKLRREYKLEYGKVGEELLSQLYEPKKWTEFFTADSPVSHGFLSSLYQEIRLYGHILNQVASKKASFNNVSLFQKFAFGSYGKDDQIDSGSQLFQKKIEEVISLINEITKKIEAKKLDSGVYTISCQISEVELTAFKTKVKSLDADIKSFFKIENDPAKAPITQKLTREQLLVGQVAEQIQVNLSQVRSILLMLSLMDWDKYLNIDKVLKDERVNYTKK